MEDQKKDILELVGQPETRIISSTFDVYHRVFAELAQIEKRIISSTFDVYLDRNQLIYVKETCSPADMAARFFLHIIPVDRRDLPERRRRRGFERIAFGLAKGASEYWGDPSCIAREKLPLYPVRYLRTGQYVPGEGRLWEGEAWIGPHNAGEERPEFPVAPGTRIISSAFDVYLRKRNLIYHKAKCGPADREAPFFLQVTPIDATVLSRDRKHRGFDDLDFNTTCTIERKLPAYAIRRIRTGQFVRGDPALWEAEFTLDQAVVSRGGNDLTPALQRTVRSVFDVTLDGRRLIYRKAACRPADREARFFLHVTPVDATALPPHQARYGFENLDFWHRDVFKFNEFGCSIRKRLPSYPIRRIRTGQYLPGEGPLWEGEFAMAPDALGQD